MIQLLIIADDLTGAADAGVQFSKKGIATLVTVDRDIDIASLDPQTTVLAVDIESRHLSPSEAADRLAKVVRRATGCGVDHFYKKTDSTLRGNIGAELEALLNAVHSHSLFFVPAHPKAQRFTRQGYQYLGNDLLHTTAFAQDPREPVDVSFVPAIIAKQSNVDTSLVSARTDEITTALQDTRNRIYVFDCNSNDDLNRIGRSLAQQRALQVLAGPAALAELLPDLLKLPTKLTPRKKNDQPILVVNGSVNNVALAQIAFAGQHGFTQITVPPAVLFAGESTSDDQLEKFADQAAPESSQPSDLILRTIEHRDELHEYIAQNAPTQATTSDICHLAARNMGRLVARILNKAKFGNCVVFGGDTALGIIEALECTSLLLAEEIIPGLALAELAQFPRPINFITKPGGFGPENVICQIRDSLRTSTSD